MLTLPTYILQIGRAIWLRITIGAFFYLSLAFVRMFISNGAQYHPLLTVTCATLYDAMGIVIFQLLYGRYSVGRDINTLSFYGVVLHLIYIGCYFAGVQWFSGFHNDASKTINILIALRCILMTNGDLLAIASPINIVKKWLLARYWFVNSYLNGLTMAIFFLFAIPLFTMMYLINTDEMRAAGIAAILFAFYVSFENARRPAITGATVADAKTVKVSEEDINTGRFMYIVALLLVWAVTGHIADDKERFFNVGYASGYSDAKSGATPTKEKDFQKALWCNMVKSRDQSDPPGLSCDNPPKR